MQNDRAVAATEAMSRLVNSFGNENAEDFITLMSREHRTLQNSFTRLCLMWIELVASDEYRTDARNQTGKDVSVKLLAAFRDKIRAEGFTGVSLDIMSKPSEYCCMI